MRRRPKWWRSTRAPALVVLIAALAVGCGDGDDGRDDPPVTTGAPSPTDGRDPPDTTPPTGSTGTPGAGVRPTVPPDAGADGFEAEPLEPDDPRSGPGGSGPTTEPPVCVPKPGMACIHEGDDLDG